jgi:hypothetical protein
MIINNLTLAYLCNDLPNAEHYKIDGGNCYYKDSFIGEIREELEETVLNVFGLCVRWRLRTINFQ